MKSGVVLAIVGWRGMTTLLHQELFDETLQKFVQEYGLPDLVVSGGAKGADTMGESWARLMKIPMQIFKPEWNLYGKSAGIRRNTDIINACTHVVAFPNDSGKGTQDSIRKAIEQQKTVIQIKIY